MTRQDISILTPVKPHSGRIEVQCLGDFISDSLRKMKISKPRVQIFRDALISLLNRKYDGHWYPANPIRGTGFREISSYFKFVDPILLQAAAKAQISVDELKQALGADVTFFVDPGCVSYRRGCTYQNTGTINQIYPAEKPRLPITEVVEVGPQWETKAPWATDLKTEVVDVLSDAGSEESSSSEEEDECFSPGSPDSGFGMGSPQLYRSSPQIHDNRNVYKNSMHCGDSIQWQVNRVSLAV